MGPEAALRIEDIKAAIAVEQSVRRHGALLFVDTDQALKVLYPDKISEALTQLCQQEYHGLIWLLTARAAP